MKPSGIHIVAEFVSCSEDILNDKGALEELLKVGVETHGMHLMSVASHQFTPIGVTVIAIISESHIAIHTYPEAYHASIDIFTCSAESQPARELLEFFKSQLKPKTVRVMELIRGLPLETKDADWITSFTGGGYEIKYEIKNRIVSKRTEYQQLEIIENEYFGKMMFLDNDLQIAEADFPIYESSLIDPILTNGNELGKIAILGGGDGGVLNALQEHNPESVVLVDIDGEVIEAAKEHLRSICGDAFEAPNATIELGDANEFLETNNGFDAIICDLTMHPEFITTMDRKTYLTQLFSRIRKSLKNGGLVSLQCCSEFDKETLDLVTGILEKDYTDITPRKTFIPSFCEKWVFVFAKAK